MSPMRPIRPISPTAASAAALATNNTPALALALVLAAAPAARAAAPAAAHPDSSGWPALFAPGLADANYPAGVWTVDGDGVLTASEDQCIWTKKVYDDFVLDLEFKTAHETNSGVIVYCSDTRNWIPNSVEVQIADDHAEKWAQADKTWQCGAIFGHLAATESAVKKPGAWNRYTITCRGPHITVVLNGKKVTEMDMRKWTSATTNPDGSKIPPWLSTPFAELATRGHIGLQGKHAGAPIYFRNLRLNELPAGGAAIPEPVGTATVWIGTGGRESQGIYSTALNLKTGKLAPVKLAAEIGSPGFLAPHPSDSGILYALCSLPGGGGGVASFKVNPDGRTLTELNRVPTGTGGAAHLAVDREARALFTAHYGAGTVAVFPLADDGTLRPRSHLVKHEGSGPDERRQRSPHPHWIGTSPDNRFVLVPDLGIDQVVIYRFDAENFKLVPHGAGKAPPGGGPRHMKFHPDGRFVFLLNELDVSVTTFAWDPAAGTLTPVETVTALPEELREVRSSGSEIRVHPNGRFVYTGNRGHDTIAAFRCDPATGRLTFVEREPVRGAWPRNFNLDPSGHWLLAAGRHSGTLALFKVDPETGGLVYAGQNLHCPAPICVLFGPPAGG